MKNKTYTAEVKQTIKNAINDFTDIQNTLLNGLEDIRIDIEVDVKQAYDVLDCVMYYFRKNNTLVNGGINGYEIKPDTELHFKEFLNSFPRGDDPQITYGEFKEYMGIIHSFFKKLAWWKESKERNNYEHKIICR